MIMNKHSIRFGPVQYNVLFKIMNLKYDILCKQIYENEIKISWKTESNGSVLLHVFVILC